MNIVERCTHAPGYCIATMSSEDTKGFIDTGLTPACVDPRVYISVRWVEEMATKMGWVAGELLAEEKRRVKKLERQLIEADKLIGAAEHTIAHFQAKRKKKVTA
jgi:hypothetical protein